MPWLGLVPRQNSSGGKTRLGRISKQGNRYIRQLLILGATSDLRYIRRNGGSGTGWIGAYCAAGRQRSQPLLLPTRWLECEGSNSIPMDQPNPFSVADLKSPSNRLGARSWRNPSRPAVGGWLHQRPDTRLHSRYAALRSQFPSTREPSTHDAILAPAEREPSIPSISHCSCSDPKSCPRPRRGTRQFDVSKNARIPFPFSRRPYGKAAGRGQGYYALVRFGADFIAKRPCCDHLTLYIELEWLGTTFATSQ